MSNINKFFNTRNDAIEFTYEDSMILEFREEFISEIKGDEKNMNEQIFKE